MMIPFQNHVEIDLDALEIFLRDNFNLVQMDPYRSAMRKLVCLFDKLKYGF